ncbi:MmcQ/YjbR family DNA-binding protein [Larkinella terrae]|uniref:MmcQ/YjbR family DNA-binding protein n=1 Tax=Larkinella terrae TaxID=2025311 RepID=A0A7K0ELD8_9BACT|nr:MmcQ/YjbR family DNA-binding protein [Larkinella terrae]MRS62637.1 MmcQ/YjbR family DNA-binding protein [Larkinella terrae]
MNIETLRQYCLSKTGATESFPFGEETLVFKVGGKMFGLTSLNDDPLSVNLKCDPELAVELREQYDAVRPGFHMNKVHWNTVIIDGTIRESELKKWIDHSYELIVKSLPKTTQRALEK